MLNVKKIILKEIDIPVVNGQLFGLLRSVTALSLAITLVFTDPYFLFSPSSLNPAPLKCEGFEKALVFCLFSDKSLWIPLFIALAICSLVISGYLIRFTSFLFFWLAYSFHTMAGPIDGGDQLILVLSLLILLVSLGDKRKNHWKETVGNKEFYGIWSLVWVGVIKLQMAVVYFQAGVAKFGVPTWADGSEIYYDIFNPMFGSDGSRLNFALFVLDSPELLLLLTWGTLFIEIFISFAILGPLWAKPIAFVFVCSLHVGIAIFLGIPSFALVMVGAASFALIPFSSHSLSLKEISKVLRLKVS